MAMELTERYRLAESSGNKRVIGYKVEFSGAYPVADGYEEDLSSEFSKINSVIIEFYQLNPETGYVLAIGLEEVTTPTTIVCKVYDEATGMAGWNEVGGGDIFGGTWYIRVEGVPVGGVDNVII
jgi:hypothetical protein